MVISFNFVLFKSCRISLLISRWYLGNENQKVKKLQNIKMYEEVAILFPVLTHKGKYATNE